MLHQKLPYDCILWKMMTGLQTPNYLRSSSDTWKKCDKPETEFCSHQITNYASVFQPICFKTYNFYSEGEHSQFTVSVTLFAVLLVHGEQLVYLPCKLQATTNLLAITRRLFNAALHSFFVTNFTATASNYSLNSEKIHIWLLDGCQPVSRPI